MQSTSTFFLIALLCLCVSPLAVADVVLYDTSPSMIPEGLASTITLSGFGFEVSDSYIASVSYPFSNEASVNLTATVLSSSSATISLTPPSVSSAVIRVLHVPSGEYCRQEEFIQVYSTPSLTSSSTELGVLGFQLVNVTLNVMDLDTSSIGIRFAYSSLTAEAQVYAIHDNHVLELLTGQFEGASIGDVVSLEISINNGVTWHSTTVTFTLVQSQPLSVGLLIPDYISFGG